MLAERMLTLFPQGDGGFATFVGSGATGRFTAFWYSFTNAVSNDRIIADTITR